MAIPYQICVNSFSEPILMLLTVFLRHASRTYLSHKPLSSILILEQAQPRLDRRRPDITPMTIGIKSGLVSPERCLARPEEAQQCKFTYDKPSVTCTRTYSRV